MEAGMSEPKPKKIATAETCAILFARNPVPGSVKTRLQTHLSAEQAAAVYTAFLRDTVDLLSRSCAARRVVAVADADGLEPLRARLDPTGDHGLDFVLQQGMDLGLRLEHALSGAFDAGARRAVILGTDSPSMPAATIDDALELLTDSDVVLGPSVDGGYYLVGVRDDAIEAAAPALFRQIEWGTGAVLEQTVGALAPSISLALLAPWYDVDHPREAAFLRSHLAAASRAGCHIGAHSLEALRGLDLPPPS